MTKLRILVACLTLSFMPVDADACSCRAELESLDDAIARSDYVFFARIVGAEIRKPWFEESWLIVELEDIIPYKGGRPPFGEVRTSPDSAACGASVVVPENYWFFTDKNGRFTKCDRTQPAYTMEGGYLTSQIMDEYLELIRAEK
jgi:hypothetical protein